MKQLITWENMKLNLNDFRTPGLPEVSMFKGIPMFKYTSETRKLIRTVIGQPVRFKFRGPRPEKYGRTRAARQASCLKEDAATFSVYLK